MRSNLRLTLTLLVVLLLLVGLNAASYVEIETAAETEAEPNRSTTNAGATGTRAFYELLQESGYKVARWQEPFARLDPNAPANGNAQKALARESLRPATLFIVGRTRRAVTEEDATNLLQWVARGGRLVIVDRLPTTSLLGNTDERRITAMQEVNAEAADREQSAVEKLVAGVKPVAPAQPTLFVRDVEQILPSRFAARFTIGEGEEQSSKSDSPVADELPSVLSPPPPIPVEGEDVKETPESAPEETTLEETASEETASDEATTNEATEDNYRSPAPVVHLADERGALLVDYAYGQGRIILLSDPFIIANNGISRADNAILALNLAGSPDALIAFDEYHQGLLAPQNEVVAYFRGTPALAIFAQGLLLMTVWLWSRGRRFARPLPLIEPDRRSKLEFISSMSELLGRARAYDLAIENIYRRTRPALARFGGTAPDASRTEIAAQVAARAGTPASKIESLMRECEDCINGAPVSARKALELGQGLRTLERELKLRKLSLHSANRRPPAEEADEVRRHVA